MRERYGRVDGTRIIDCHCCESWQVIGKLRLTREQVEGGLVVGALAVHRDARVLVSNCKAMVAGADVHAQGHATARVYLKHVKVVVVHVKGVNQLHLASRGEDNNAIVVVGGQKPQLARLYHALDGGGGSKNTQVVHHQEPVNGLHVAMPPGKATRDQVMAVHVKVTQGTW